MHEGDFQKQVANYTAEMFLWEGKIRTWKIHNVKLHVQVL